MPDKKNKWFVMDVTRVLAALLFMFCQEKTWVKSFFVFRIFFKSNLLVYKDTSEISHWRTHLLAKNAEKLGLLARIDGAPFGCLCFVRLVAVMCWSYRRGCVHAWF